MQRSLCKNNFPSFSYYPEVLFSTSVKCPSENGGIFSNNFFAVSLIRVVSTNNSGSVRQVSFSLKHHISTPTLLKTISQSSSHASFLIFMEHSQCVVVILIQTGIFHTGKCPVFSSLTFPLHKLYYFLSQ